MRPDRVGLKHHADVALVRRHDDVAAAGEHELVADEDLAPEGFLQSGDRAERRRLAAAAGTEKREELSLRDFEIDAAHGVDLAALGLIADVQIFDADHPLTICIAWRRNPITRMTTVSSNSVIINSVPIAATAGT